MSKLTFADRAWEEYLFWQEADRKTLKEMLEAEFDEELGYTCGEARPPEVTNYRNGRKSKTLKSSMGEIEIEVPQDRYNAPIK